MIKIEDRLFGFTPLLLVFLGLSFFASAMHSMISVEAKRRYAELKGRYSMHDCYWMSDYTFYSIRKADNE